MLLRPLHPHDIEPIAHWMAATPLWQRYGVTATSAAQRLQNGVDQQATLLVAEVTGAPVGFVWYVTQGAFQRSGYVVLLGVATPWRSQGIGSALLVAAETAMFAQVADVFLLVADFNHAAQAFYRRLGYELVGSLPAYVMPEITELIFRKRRPTTKHAA